MQVSLGCKKLFEKIELLSTFCNNVLQSTATEPNLLRERFDFWVVKCAADRYSTSFSAIMQKKLPARFSEALEIECRGNSLMFKPYINNY